VSSNPKARSAWAIIKKELKESKELLEREAAERKRLSEELKVAKAQKPPDMTELAALKTQVEDYEAQLARVSLEHSRAFKARYDEPLKTKKNWAATVLEKNVKLDKEAAVKLAEQLSNPNNTTDDIQNLLGEFPPVVQSTLATYAFDAIDLQNQRKQAISDWRATQSVLADQDQRLSAAELSKVIVEGTSQAVDRLGREQSWIFLESQGNAEWNKQRDSIIGAARHILREARPEEVTKYVLEGVAAARYRSMAEAEHQRANALQAELAGYISLRPGVGGGAVVEDPTPPPAAPVKKPVNPDAWLTQAFAKK